MSKYQEKMLVKYACLIAPETISEDLRKYLSQEIDFIDNFLDHWKKYD